MRAESHCITTLRVFCWKIMIQRCKQYLRQLSQAVYEDSSFFAHTASVSGDDAVMHITSSIQMCSYNTTWDAGLREPQFLRASRSFFIGEHRHPREEAWLQRPIMSRADLISNISRESLSNICGVALSSRISEVFCRGDLTIFTAGNDRFGQFQEVATFLESWASIMSNCVSWELAGKIML
jgi:hypothetical protein